MVAFSDLHFDYRIFREALSLQRAGHRISIVAVAFTTQPLKGWESFQVHLIPLDRSRSLRRLYPAFWKRAYELLADSAADVYHAHDLDALWPAARAARQRDVPLVYDSHEFWTEQSSLVGRPLIRAFWSQLEQRLIQRTARVIAVSQSIARLMGECYGLDEVVVLRNLPLYRPPVPSDRIRAELGLEPARPIVLYQGGFLSGNGLSEQIEAASGFGQAAFVLIGDGPCEASLKEQVRKADLGNRVFFLPRVPFQQLHDYTCSADLGLCLIKGTGRSFYYSMPNKLFEYLMAGLPVLASDFPEMSQVIRQSQAGEVVNPEDISAIRQQVCSLLGDEARRQSCREAALKAARLYNWEQEATRLIELYRAL
jgi:glycosyltransferase involved in cell wall biosynthesis